MADNLDKASFEPHLNEKFKVHPQGMAPVEVQLVDITDKSSDSVENFSLMFRGPLDPVFRHNTHRVRHAKLGEFDLFLGPVTTGKTDGVYYQAVFNRFRKNR